MQTLEPSEIWGLIVKADEALKYASGERSAVMSRRARELLTRALEEAERSGNARLADQARLRLTEVDAG